jgi:hypothetical protein
MKKIILITASLLSPLVVLAQVAAPADAASLQKQSRSVSLQCQQQAALKKLVGVERKQFLVTCINPDAKSAPVSK